MTEIQERNTALRAVGREEEVEHLGVVVSMGTGENPVVKVRELLEDTELFTHQIFD